MIFSNANIMKRNPKNLLTQILYVTIAVPYALARFMGIHILYEHFPLDVT